MIWHYIRTVRNILTQICSQFCIAYVVRVLLRTEFLQIAKHNLKSVYNKFRIYLVLLDKKSRIFQNYTRDVHKYPTWYKVSWMKYLGPSKLYDNSVHIFLVPVPDTS